MNEETDALLSALSIGQTAMTARALIEEILAGAESRIDAKIFRTLRAGETLDPQLAIQSWIEKSAINDLRRALSTKERKGQHASKALEPDLTA